MENAFKNLIINKHFSGEIVKVFTGRILLCKVTAEYMNTGLNLLGINTVSRM